MALRQKKKRKKSLESLFIDYSCSRTLITVSLHHPITQYFTIIDSGTVFVCSHVELVSDDLTEQEEFSMMADLEEMDLLGEIFDTLNTQSSTEPGLLYSTRSLDVFTSDCTDFISRVSIHSTFFKKNSISSHLISSHVFQRSLTTPSQESLSLSTGNNGSLMSWDEGLEDGPHIEEESELPNDEPDRDMQDRMKEGHRNSGEEQTCVDLGRLVEDPVDFRQELDEELNEDCKQTKRSSRDDQEEASLSSRENQEEISRSYELVQCETSRSSGEKQENHWQAKSDDDNGESDEAQRRQVKEVINKKGCVGHHDLTKENSNPESLLRNSFQEREHFPEDQLNADTSVSSDKKDEEWEEHREQSTPTVVSKVSLFQVKAFQAKGSPESVRPGYGHKILDTSLKISPRGPGAFWVTASTKTDDSTVKSPTTSNLSDTTTEDEDLPPPKVSELKKRFEQ